MENMENITHNYLTKLRIISKIPINGRLDITQNDLNIYHWSILNWTWRKIYGDSKENTAKYLTDLYREVNSFSDQMMHNITTEQMETHKNRKLTLLISLTEKVKQSITGIRNLIDTYKGYLKVVSQLECLEQDIITPQYNLLKSFIPESMHTHIIKTPIVQTHFTPPRSTIQSTPKTIPINISPPSLGKNNIALSADAYTPEFSTPTSIPDTESMY
jgi:hypothetical protein